MNTEKVSELMKWCVTKYNTNQNTRSMIFRLLGYIEACLVFVEVLTIGKNLPIQSRLEPKYFLGLFRTRKFVSIKESYEECIMRLANDYLNKNNLV